MKAEFALKQNYEHRERGQQSSSKKFLVRHPNWLLGDPYRNEGLPLRPALNGLLQLISSIHLKGDQVRISQKST